MKTPSDPGEIAKISSQENSDLQVDDRSQVALKETGYLFRDEKIKDLQQYRSLRDSYAKKCFTFMVGWSVLVGVILIAAGCDIVPFQLSDTVLAVLVGGATINVVGLVHAIVTGLFKGQER